MAKSSRLNYRKGKFLNAIPRQGERGQRAHVGAPAHAGQPSRLRSCRSPAWWRGESFATKNQSVAAGARFGLIRFGSRADVFLPAGTIPLVSEGQTSLAGETVIAEIGAAPRSRSFRVD